MRKLSLTRQAASTKTQTKTKVENIMKTGKITAKLRDAVPVFLMAEGKEAKVAAKQEAAAEETSPADDRQISIVII